MIAKTPPATHLAHRYWLTLAQPPMPYSAWFSLKPSMTDRSPSATGRFSTSVISRRLTGIFVSQAAGGPSFHPEFDQLFAFGIDPEPGQLPRRPHGQYQFGWVNELMATRSLSPRLP